MNWRRLMVADRPRPSALDATLAATVLLIGLLQMLAGQLGSSIVVMAASTVAFAVIVLCARPVPGPAVVALCVATVITWACGGALYNDLAEVVATLIVLYCVCVVSVWWVALIASCLVYTTIALTALEGPAGLAWGAILMAAPLLAGQAIRNRRLLIDRLEKITAELERSRDARAAAAVVDERLRLARELHDVIAHAVSVMVVQATATEATVFTDPHSAQQSAVAVQQSGRQALVELRGLLGVLRSDESSSSRLTPQPGLAELPQLVHRMAAAGLTVTVSSAGKSAALPPGIDLAAFRIIQESLTNALKHGGGQDATIEIRQRADLLELEIVSSTDDAAAQRSPNSEPPGHGLAGMHERAAVYGGTVRAGATPGGRFRVLARIPLTEESTDDR